MVTSKKFTLKLLKLTDGVSQLSDCQLYCQATRPCRIKLEHLELGSHNFEGFDIFDAFCNLRIFIEQRNWRILCNGARIDAYPSPMSRNMCGGSKLYCLKMGQPTKRDDLVHIFAEALPERVGTVEQQYNYYKKWLESFSASDRQQKN